MTPLALLARISDFLVRHLHLSLTVLVALLFLASLSIGRGGSFLPPGLFEAAEANRAAAWLILEELRLPRALLAVLIGATLGISGAILQGLFRNPLAEPGIVGASNGAALGAVVVFYFGAGATTPFNVAVGGIAGALGALSLLFLLAGRSASIATLILAGVAISALAGALTALALNLAPNPYAALEIVFWTLGSLTDRSMNQVELAGPLMLAGLFIAALTARSLDALSLGEDTAASLGFNPDRTKLLAIAGTGLAVGAAVSVAGVIGFVGLVVPHLMRPLVGHMPSRLLIPSGLAGAALLLAADILVRLPEGAEPKIGVLTSLIGGPFFLYLVLAMRRQNQT